MQGNVSHIHAILRTLFDITKPKELEQLLNKIRGCIADLFHEMELIKMRKEGWISSVEHLIELLNQAQAYLTHHCDDRCQIPKTDDDGNTVYICKRKDNFYRTLTPQMHTMQSLGIKYSAEATRILNRLGLMKGEEVLVDYLKSEFHVPPSSQLDPKFSPTNPELFIQFPSSQNLQFTTGESICGYLVKYVTINDDLARVHLIPPRKEDPTHAKAVIERLHNTKITSNKILAQKTRLKSVSYGRVITQTECITVVLGDPLVTSTVEFAYVPTSPREYRSSNVDGRKRTNHRIHDRLVH